MSELERSLDIKAPISLAFSHCSTLYSGLGYQLQKSVEPAFLEFRKKGTIWTTDEIDAPHIVSVHLAPLDRDTTHVVLHYDCQWGTGNFTQKSVGAVERHVLSLLSLAGTSVSRAEKSAPDRICVNCRRGIPINSAFCPHCGKSL